MLAAVGAVGLVALTSDRRGAALDARSGLLKETPTLGGQPGMSTSGQASVSPRVSTATTAASASPFDPSPSTSQSAQSARTDMADDDASDLSFTAYNSYTLQSGDLGSHYPWVDAPVVEPYRETTFTVTGARHSHEYHWTIEGGVDSESGTPSSALTSVGNVITYTPGEVGEYSVAILEYPQTMGTSGVLGEMSRNYSTGKIIVRYVRRELRSLTPEDREAFMQGCEVVWTTEQDAGKALYGDDFIDIKYLAGLHNHLSGDRNCDHMHDGLGFMTQHAGLTYLFEKSLQAVNPALTVPYWDWTVDTTTTAEYNRSVDDLWEWDVWGADYFGSGRNAEHTVTEGRWAYTNITTNNWNDTHNPYGHMRAPWNMNAIPYVTRFNYTGSVKYAYDGAEMGMPTCMDFWTMLMTCNTWYDFAWKMPYDPHARVHSVIGGSEAGEAFNKLARFFDDDTMELISKLHFYWTKNLWRSNKLEFPEYCSSDTPQHQCKGVCDGMEEAIRAGTGGAYIDTFGDSDVIEAIKDLSTEDQITVITSMCESGLAIGDQMESASPADISFWPIHPNLERIWMIKKLSGTFSNETWPKSGVSLLSSTGDECYGHGADDVLPYGNIYGVAADKNLTNAELYDIMNPLEDTLPYIYDSFDLAHCQYYDFDFTSWLPDSPTFQGLFVDDATAPVEELLDDTAGQDADGAADPGDNPSAMDTDGAADSDAGAGAAAGPGGADEEAAGGATASADTAVATADEEADEVEEDSTHGDAPGPGGDVTSGFGGMAMGGGARR